MGCACLRCAARARGPNRAGMAAWHGSSSWGLFRIRAPDATHFAYGLKCADATNKQSHALHLHAGLVPNCLINVLERHCQQKARH